MPTFADSIAPLRELHVAIAGSDQSGDGTPQRPYATIRFAMGQATPGTAVRVHPGTYQGGIFLEQRRGTAAAPIWIGGAPGEARPVISGGSDGLHLVRCAYLVVHDLEIRGAANNGVNSDDGGEYANAEAAHHQVFRSLHIHDIGGTGNQDGLKLSGIRDFVVVDCEITRCGGAMSGSGIDMVGCHRGVIARSFLHDLSANAVQAKGGTADIDVRWCRLVDAGERALNIGGSTGFKFFRPPLSETEPNAEARRIRAVANVIVGARAPVAFVGATDCLFANNTVINPGRWVMRILQETVTTPPYTFEPCANNTFAGNLVYFNRSALNTFVNIGSNTSAATFTFSHNLWYAHDNPGASTPVLPAPEISAVIGQNPLLLNPKGGDYSICGDSPAAGHGLEPAPGPGDIRGTCWRTPPAIGAYEVPLNPAADLDGNGRVDSQDFFDFLTAFFNQHPSADFNADQQVNSQDAFDFLAAFFRAC